MLSDLKFGLDHNTGRIQVEDEANYGDLPPANTGVNRRASRLRQSGWLGPRSPVTPRSPGLNGTTPSPSPRTTTFNRDVALNALESGQNGSAA